MAAQEAERHGDDRVGEKREAELCRRSPESLDCPDAGKAPERREGERGREKRGQKPAKGGVDVVAPDEPKETAPTVPTS
jgi:hypothetical protein